MTYKAPLRDFQFILEDVLDIDRFANLPGFADASSDLVRQILEEAGRFSEEVLAPLNKVGDQEGCQLSADGAVKTPTGWKEAYRQLVDAGWPSLSCDKAYGGQGLPSVVTTCYGQMTAGANAAWSMYPGLTHAAYAGLHAGGTEAQKQLYLPKLVSGQWTGTMNLTEPQCGTDPHQGGPAGRRQLPHHRPEDLDQLRRARLRRKHHPPGAGPHRRRTGRGQGHQPVRGAEVPAQRRRDARRAQQRRVRRPGAQDGHPRQRHLRHGL
jgi:hypothetical protein